MTIPTITIDLDKKCAECDRGGAAPNGLCMGCTAKAMSGKLMRSATGKTVAERIRQSAAQSRRDRRRR